MTSEQFEELLVPLLVRLNSFALHLAREPNQADDLVQETLTKAFEYRDKFTPGTNFKAWIFQIMMYQHLNKVRAHRSRQEVFIDFFAGEHDRLQPEAPASEIVEHKWECNSPILVDDMMKRCLDSLSAEHRAVFLFVVMDDLSYQETAEKLGIPIGTVMSRMFRAREKLLESVREGR